MKVTYPENIDQIGDFYRGKLQDGNIEPSASLWESIESNLSIPDVSSAASASSSASANNFLSFAMVWKGALIIGAVGALTVALVVNSKKEEDLTPLNKNNSVKNKNIVVGDTIFEARNNVSVTEKGGDVTPVKSTEENSQIEEVVNESHTDNKIEPIVTDTVIPAIAPAQVVEEKDKEEKPKSKEKEAETNPGNFFERKLKQQKDTSSHLFKPNK